MEDRVFVDTNIWIYALTESKVEADKKKGKVSFWDSLIVASAIENQCSILYTEDMQNGQIIEDRLKIVNPIMLQEV